MTYIVIVKIAGLIFDLIVVGGYVWLVGWHGWSFWWIILVLMMCEGSTRLSKKCNECSKEEKTEDMI